MGFFHTKRKPFSQSHSHRCALGGGKQTGTGGMALTGHRLITHYHYYTILTFYILFGVHCMIDIKS